MRINTNTIGFAVLELVVILVVVAVVAFFALSFLGVTAPFNFIAAGVVTAVFFLWMLTW